MAHLAGNLFLFSPRSIHLADTINQLIITLSISSRFVIMPTMIMGGETARARKSRSSQQLNEEENK